MRNILLIFGEVLVCYSSIYFLSKKIKTDGIYIYAILATTAACIMGLKTISIAEVPVPVGFCLTTSLIIGANILTENNKKEELRNYIGLIFLTAIISGSILNLSGLMSSSDFNNLANDAYNNVFYYNIRIYIALTLSVILAILLSDKVYDMLRKNSNKQVVSNIFTIIITTFAENIVFVVLAYLYKFDTIDLILCLVFRYIIKTIIGIIGTIPLYIINKEIK